MRMLLAIAAFAFTGIVLGQSEIIVDNPAGVAVGSWPQGSNTLFYGTDFYTNEAGTGADTFTWTATIPALAQYNVYAWWPNGGSERATNAKYTVYHAAGSTTVTVNQKQQAGQWNLLGTFVLSPGSARVVLTDDANGRVAADAIKWGPATPPAPPAADIIVDNLAGTVTSGNWTNSSQAPNHYASNYRYSPNPTSGDKFTWATTLSGGQYNVYAWWPANTFGLASNAKYTVNRAGGSTVVTVDQRFNSGQWNLLGTFTFNAGQATIFLAGPANDEIDADAVRWQLVNGGSPPTVSITNPANNDVFQAPTSISITASAQDTDGSIARVDFYAETALIGTATTAPYTIQWTNPVPGPHTLSAIATDNAGFATLSAQVLIKVNAAKPLYFLQVDHLNTPRSVFDDQQQLRWQWAQVESFGTNAPNENPTGLLSAFEMPLRYPGQYADKETGLNYNYFRDYDPSIGRYAESDPIGRDGGPNTYAYIGSDPLRHRDPMGLVKWKGEVYTFSAAGTLGGAVYEFDLKSECKNGKEAYVHIWATAVLVGAGVKYTGTGSPVEFDDGYADVDPDALQGSFAVVSAGLTFGGKYGGVGVPGFGLGGSYSGYVLGQAISLPTSTPTPEVGYDKSVFAGVGRSYIWRRDVRQCGCPFR